MNPVLTDISERDLQANIVAALEMAGWRTYHTYDSRRSNPGFPDIYGVRDRAFVAIECKSERGRLTADQEAWLDALAELPGGAFVGVVRPSDWMAGVLDGVFDAPRRVHSHPHNGPHEHD